MIGPKANPTCDCPGMDAKWAVVHGASFEPENGEEGTGEERKALLLSSMPPKGYAIYFDFLRDDSRDVEKFFDHVRMAVSCARSLEGKKPITNSKGFSIGKRAIADDWATKVTKTVNQRIEEKSPIFFGLVDSETSKGIRSASYRAARIAGRDPIEFIAIQTREPEREIVLCSASFEGLTRIASPEEGRKAVSQATSEIRTGDEAKASPRWYAKPSSKWKKSGIAKGPSAVRFAAMQIGRKAAEVETSPIASMVDAAAFLSHDSEVEKFLEIVKRE